MKSPADILKPLAEAFGELSPTCRQVARLQSEALDHPLSFRRRLGLGVHLLLCKWCRRYGKQIRFLRTAAHQHAEHESHSPPQPLSTETRERIKQRLRAE